MQSKKFRHLSCSVEHPLLLLLVAITPLATFWLQNVIRSAIIADTPGKYSSLVQPANPRSKCPSKLVSGHSSSFSGKTRGIPEAVVIFLGITHLVYAVGIIQERYTRNIYRDTGFSLGMVCQAALVEISQP